MEKHYIYILAIVLIATSCSKITEIEKWEITKIPTDSISVGTTTDSIISFTARSWGSNGCYVYSHNEYNRVGDYINITIYGKYPTSAYCTMAFIPIYTQMTVKIPQPDTFYFHFWISDLSSYDTMVIVP